MDARVKTVKKAECRRIDAFELWCWRRLLRVPWTARRSNQSILKINPMMLKLKLQYFGHLMRRVDSFDKTDAGRDWGQEEKETTEDEMARWHHWLDGVSLSELRELVMDREAWACCDSWGRKESDATERLNWTVSSSQNSKKNLIGLEISNQILRKWFYMECAIRQWDELLRTRKESSSM